MRLCRPRKAASVGRSDLAKRVADFTVGLWWLCDLNVVLPVSGAGSGLTEMERRGRERRGPPESSSLLSPPPHQKICQPVLTFENAVKHNSFFLAPELTEMNLFPRRVRSLSRRGAVRNRRGGLCRIHHVGHVGGST